MTNHIQTLAAGTMLDGRYKVGGLLGHGGMGSVYRGTDVVLDREVALKVFRADVAGPGELARQQAEARLLARLNHHGLVTLFDAGKLLRGQGEAPFLVMELVEGTDLRHLLAAGPLAGADVRRLAVELADALQYIHQHGMVHRDLKPANILLTRYAEGAPLRPKIADFGIARMLDGARVTATNMMPGTAAYLSPEQASGGPVGPPADVYSLGLVLLEALTGKVAYPGPPLEAAVARLSRDPDIPEVLGRHWVALLAAMTARKPDTRPSAADVVRSLQQDGDWNGMENQEGEATAVFEAAAPAAAPTALPDASGSGPAGRTAVLNTTVLPGTAPSDTARQKEALPALSGSQATNATQWQAAPVPPAREPADQGRPLSNRLRRLTARGRPRLVLLLAVCALGLVLALALLNTTLRQSPTPNPAEQSQPVLPAPFEDQFRELEESVTP